MECPIPQPGHHVNPKFLKTQNEKCDELGSIAAK